MADVEKNRFTSISVRLDTYHRLCSMKGDESHDSFLRWLIGAYQYRKGHDASEEMKDAERAHLFAQFSAREKRGKVGASGVRVRKEKKERAPATERAPQVGKQKVSSEGKKDTSSDEGLRRKFDAVKYLIE